MEILLLCFFPLAILIAAHFIWPKEVTLPEIALGAVVSLVLANGMFQIGKHSQLAALELWNGEITSTEKDVNRYTESYDCRCRTVTTGTGTNKTSRRVCDTCYRHGYNMSWNALSNIGTFRIDYQKCTIDSRSRCINRYSDPQRWLDIEIGDPVSRTNSYQNYVRAADFSVFNEGDAEQYDITLEYPINVFDHYRVNRVLTDGVSLPAGQSIDDWNQSLAEILKVLGPEKQANMVVVLTSAGNPSYADQLIAKWLGGNKNDIIIIAGFPTGTVDGAPSWVKVNSWALQDIMNVTMRDELLDNPDWWASTETFFPNVQAVVMEHFERRPMAEFEYLKNEVKPSTGQIIVFTIVSIIAGLGMAWVFLNFDLFGGMRGNRRFR